MARFVFIALTSLCSYGAMAQSTSTPLLDAGNVFAAPSKMRAAVVTNRSWDFKFHLDKLAVIDIALPKPGNGEVLVKVHASNINPVDHKIVEMTGIFWKYPHVLGFDLAGLVVAVGPGCQRIKVGDAVWGEATTITEAVSPPGTQAQYVAVSESVLGLKPKSLSMLEAGSMPMVALTGYESLSWAAGGANFTRGNMTVLVLGGSGGTGHLGIQLAKAMGASHVITTCSGRHAGFVKSLGADEVIDYHKHNYYDVIPNKSVDVIYDCVGQRGTGDHAYRLLKKGGHFVTLLMQAGASLSSKLRRPDVSEYMPNCIGACSQHDRIDKIAHIVDQGKLKVHIDTVFSLEEIEKAYNHSLAGHTTGKVAVQVVANDTAVFVPARVPAPSPLMMV